MRVRKGFLSVGLAVVVLAPPVAHAQLFQEPGPTVRPDRISGATREAPADGVVRSRRVRIDRSLLPRAEASTLLPAGGQAVRLNLFDDATVEARITRVESLPRGTAWIGRVSGEPLSSVVMVDVDGVVSGSVASLETLYRIAWDGSRQVVEEVDRRLLSDDDCFAVAPPAPAELQVAPDVVAAGDDGSLVDVLVVYTPAAKAAAGGAAGMLSKINLAVTETNTGYADSGVIQRLRLAGTAEVSFTETLGDMGVDLDRVTSPSDGHIDNVHGLRDTYKADLVTLVGSGYAGGICGIAWVGSNSASFAPYAFNVVNLSCLTGYYSFGHELGHNMGLNHDRATAGCPSGGCGSGAYSYSFGYRDPAAAFRTVMAYNCTPSCPRVLHFSNPNVTEAGKPTGVSEVASNSAHAALSLNNTRVTVSNWRQAPSAPPFGSFDTPASGATGLAGNVAVTGWALDDAGVSKVDIWRNPVTGETPAANGKIYVGDATFVRGARSDVQSAYPSYPNADRAGWGYMLLTNFLPSSGNGTFTLYAYAYDSGGLSTLLGSKTVTVNNASATKPFGTLDTPGQGATVSGSAYVVWGWALTPLPGAIPTNGSTIWVYIDGSPVGHPVYNLSRSDIATLFPGYANTGGAVGYFTLNTTTLSNGMHNISWSVTDDRGRTDGIGSRYFWVQN